MLFHCVCGTSAASFCVIASFPHSLDGPSAGLSRYRTDLCHQVVRVDRLDDIVASTLAQCPDTIRLLRLDAADHYGNMVQIRITRNLTCDLKTVFSRHDDVHQNQMRLEQPYLVERHISILRGLDLKSFFFRISANRYRSVGESSTTSIFFIFIEP